MQNIVPIDGRSLEFYDTYRRELRQKILSPEKLLPEAISEQDKPKYGFGVLFSFGYESNELSGVDCFTAKYNKKGDKLLSGFEITRLEEYPDIEEHHQPVLQLVSRMQAEFELRHSDQGDIQHLFPLLKNLFQLLSSDIHCYYRYWNRWYSMDDKKIKKSELSPVSIVARPYLLEFDLFDDGEFLVLKPFLVFDNERIPFVNKEVKHILIEDLLATNNNQLYLVDSLTTVAALSEMSPDPIQKTFHEHKEVFIRKYALPLAEDFKINNLSTSVKEKKVTPKQFEKKLYISDMGQFVLFRPFVNYGAEMEINILKGGSKVFYANAIITVVERNEDEEAEFLELIKKLHPKFGRQYPDEFFYLKIDDMMKNHWFFDAFEDLSSQGSHH